MGTVQDGIMDILRQMKEAQAPNVAALGGAFGNIGRGIADKLPEVPSSLPTAGGASVDPLTGEFTPAGTPAKTPGWFSNDTGTPAASGTAGTSPTPRGPGVGTVPSSGGGLTEAEKFTMPPAAVDPANFSADMAARRGFGAASGDQIYTNANLGTFGANMTPPPVQPEAGPKVDSQGRELNAEGVPYVINVGGPVAAAAAGHGTAGDMISNLKQSAAVARSQGNEKQASVYDHLAFGMLNNMPGIGTLTEQKANADITEATAKKILSEAQGAYYGSQAEENKAKTALLPKDYATAHAAKLAEIEAAHPREPKFGVASYTTKDELGNTVSVPVTYDTKTGLPVGQLVQGETVNGMPKNLTQNTVYKGYRFKGGDPSKKENWEVAAK